MIKYFTHNFSTDADTDPEVAIASSEDDPDWYPEGGEEQEQVSESRSSIEEKL